MVNDRPQGSLWLMRVFGIDIYIHWLWFLLLAYELGFLGSTRHTERYSHLTWNLLEFLSLFAIVVMHELGHALACRSVGGEVRCIQLWLLGGMAFVKPPMRPGAVLWSIAAGPLVNVVLAPLLILLAVFAGTDALPVSKDLGHYLTVMAVLNVALLLFNMLPIYPLDGGQILHSILWFFFGFARSLRFVAAVGILAAIALGILMVMWAQTLGLVLALFIGWQAYNAYVYARRLQAAGVEPD